MLLIGSRALTVRAPHLLSRKPKDFDFICTKNEFDDWLSINAEKVGANPNDPLQVYPSGNKMIVHGKIPCEFEIISPGSSAEMLCDIVKNDKETLETKFGNIPNIDVLFTLKISHRYLKDSPHFWKNLYDYHRMKMIGAKTRPEYEEFLRLREKETYKNKTPRLYGVSKKDFFNENSGIEYVYDHDSIHESVKHLDMPAYRYFMKDGEQVQCDKKKFFDLPRDTQLLSVLEESYVLALERSQIPFKNVDPTMSFRMAISKVATSITSGWWREFAYENLLDVLKMYSSNYVSRFEEGLKSGIVKPFKADAPNNPYR